MRTAPLAAFLDAVATGPPRGAGAGSATAVVAAIAAALTELVASRVSDETGRARAAALRERLVGLAEADAAAYARAMDSGGDPRGEATDIPLEIATAASEVAGLTASLASNARGPVAGDALAASSLARAATRAAAQLVLVNLRDDSDDARAAQARRLAEA